MVFVGEQEVCRGGVPAPAPPTEVSSWSSDLWSSDAAAVALAAACGDSGSGGSSSSSGVGGKGGSGRGRGVEVRACVVGRSTGKDGYFPGLPLGILIKLGVPSKSRRRCWWSSQDRRRCLDVDFLDS